MAEQTAAEQPAWLVGVQQPEKPVYQQPVAQAANDIKTHAYWFAWARQHEPDVNRCHLAAFAASGALAAGKDAAEAATAAQQAAQQAPPGASTGVPPFVQTYSAFYAWAVNDLRLDPDRGHQLAHAAAHAAANGGGTKEAADVGLQAVGLKAARSATAPLSLSRDPGFRSTIIGGICLFAVLFLPFYFLVLPVSGFLYGLRALGTGRLYFSIAGLALNGLALLLGALIFFRVF